jgi:hypothetical protein
MIKCKSCEVEIEDTDSDECDYIEGIGYVCEACISDDRLEPVAIVRDLTYENMPRSIGLYHNDTDGDFEYNYHKTDGWRGYYELESEHFIKIIDDCILSMSNDANNLKKFEDKMVELCQDNDIELRRVTTRTSNCCSSGYDLFVPKTDMPKLKEIEKQIDQLRKQYRDDTEFRLTASGQIE